MEDRVLQLLLTQPAAALIEDWYTLLIPERAGHIVPIENVWLAPQTFNAVLRPFAILTPAHCAFTRIIAYLCQPAGFQRYWQASHSNTTQSVTRLFMAEFLVMSFYDSLRARLYRYCADCESDCAWRTLLGALVFL